MQNIKTISLVIGLPLLCGTTFALLMGTHYYAYFIYVLLGLVFYLLIKCLGREVAFLFMIPILIFALVSIGWFFLLDFNDHNGLNPLKIHPFVLSWLIAFSLHFIEDIVNKKVRFDKIVFTGMMVIITYFMITFIQRGFNGVSMGIHNYLGPITLFLFAYYNGHMDVSKVNKIVRGLIWIAVIIGVIGVYEYIVQSDILHNIYEEEAATWLDSTFREGYRIKTIIGHPLDNAMFFIFAMIMVQMYVNNIKIKYGLLLLFAVDILMTGSRSFFILSFLILLYNKEFFKGGLQKLKQHSIMLGCAGLIIVGTFASPLGSTFLNRIDGASDSTEARFMLVDYFLQHMFAFQMMGLGGATENIIMIDKENNPVVLENPWFILYFDVGVLIVIYLLLLYFIFRKVGNKYLVIVFILSVSGYNSFGVRSNVNYFLFFLLAYGYLLAEEKKKVKLVEDT